VLDPKVAVIVAVVTVATAVVLTLNVALFFPAGMVTGEVTVALALLELTVTLVLVAAVPFRVIVPTDVAPPCRVVGLRLKVLTANAVTLKVCVSDPPLYVAVITELPTPTDVTVNVAVVEPAATVTVLGTVATDVDAEDRLTLIPPAGAAAESVTVPVPLDPRVTVRGLIVKAERLGLTTLPIWRCHSPRP